MDPIIPLGIEAKDLPHCFKGKTTGGMYEQICINTHCNIYGVCEFSKKSHIITGQIR